MTELEMFDAEYVASLPIAPRIFRVGETISVSYMPRPTGVWEGIDGYSISVETQLPPTGRVMRVLQVKQGGSGHIRARFKDGQNTWLVEYHFKSNPEIK